MQCLEIRVLESCLLTSGRHLQESVNDASITYHQGLWRVSITLARRGSRMKPTSSPGDCGDLSFFSVDVKLWHCMIKGISTFMFQTNNFEHGFSMFFLEMTSQQKLVPGFIIPNVSWGNYLKEGPHLSSNDWLKGYMEINVASYIHILLVGATYIWTKIRRHTI